LNWGSWRSHFGACATAFALVADAAAGEVPANDDKAGLVQLPASVRMSVEAALTPPLPAYRHPIQKIGIESKLPLGLSRARMLSLDYLPNGLVSVVEQATKIPVDRVSSSTVAERLVMGPVDLLASTGTTITASASTSVMAGGAYIPFTLSSNKKLTSASIAVELSGDLRQAVLAEPGSSYAYRITTDTHLTSKGSGLLDLLDFRRSSDTSLTFNVACRVGVDAPASEVFPDLRGTYRKVECDVTNPKGAGSQHTWAFLSDSGYYVQLSSRSGKLGTDHKVTSVEYRSP
jgi:hypothetical protein